MGCFVDRRVNVAELTSKGACVSPTALPADWPPDIENSWANTWIREILQVGLIGLEVYPDGNFTR